MLTPAGRNQATAFSLSLVLRANVHLIHKDTVQLEEKPRRSRHYKTFGRQCRPVFLTSDTTGNHFLEEDIACTLCLQVSKTHFRSSDTPWILLSFCIHLLIF